MSREHILSAIRARKLIEAPTPGAYTAPKT